MAAKDPESLRLALEREAAAHARTRESREETRQRLATVETTVGKLKSQIRATQERLDQQCARTNELRQQVKAERKLADEQAEGLRKKLASRRPTPLDALITQLTLRGAVPKLLQEERTMALAREERFMRSSAQYATVVAAAQQPNDAVGKVTIEGLGWWVPKDERMPQRLERAEGQGFPMRAISQTRQVALGGIMLDLGGNIGRTSITRVLLGDVRAVYAAEPEPANYACLVRNVVEHGLRGFVMPDNVAIGAAKGEVILRRSRFIGGHRVLTPGKTGRAETITVPSWPLDEWLPHHGIDIDAVAFVKVDVQGQETNILRGAERLLAKAGVNWQIELDPNLLTRAGTSLEELCGLLTRHFTHFIDLSSGVTGSIQGLTEAVAYLGGEQHKTDVLVFRTTPAA